MVHLTCSSILHISCNFKLALKLASEKAMAPHSSTLAWEIPWVEEPGGLQSMGSQSRTQCKYEKYRRHSERQHSLPAKVRKGDYKHTKYFS